MNILKKTVLAASAVALMSGAALAADIKVGSVGGVTGGIADLIPAILAGRDLAAAQVNANGGLLAGDTMKLIVADSGCEAKVGVDAGQKVVNVEQVVAVIGASCSGASIALATSVVIPAGLLMISDTASAPGFSDLDDNDLVFRANVSDSFQGSALAKAVWDSGVRSIAVAYANDDYNAGIAGAFVPAFEAIGGTITSSQAHEPKKSSYRGELATLAGAGDADALAVFAYFGASGITVIKNSLENGLFDNFFGADGMLHESVIEQVGAENIAGKLALTQPSADHDTDAYKNFASDFEAATEYKGDANFAANGYDATFLVALAIEIAGSTDRLAIAAAARKLNDPAGMVILPGQWAEAKAAIAAGKSINYEGASGTVDFDEKGDVPGGYSLHTANAAGGFDVTPLK